MTINYTTLLGLAEPVTGTESGTWGDDVNKGITDYLDIAVAGTQTISGSQTAVTLSVTNGSSAGNNIAQAGSGSTGSSQYQVINCTGNPAGLLTITVPASSKTYVIINATSTSQSVKIVGTGPTSGVTIASGQKAFVAWNGTDFVRVTVPSPTGTSAQLLANDGSGGFSNVTIGSGLSYSTGTLAASGSGGTVTTVSVATANGLAGTVSNPTTTPAITLTTSITGVLKGNGTAISAATVGTDYVAPGTATNFTALQTFTGTTTNLSSKFLNAKESVTVSATAATGTIAYYATTQSVLYYTTNASANWVVNLTGASTPTTLDSMMSTGESVTVAFLVTQGSTAYYNTSVQVDGTTSGVTTKWQGGSAPIAGNISGIDAYVYTVIKTGSATFTVLASQTQFA
jgi:hypothetical protein